jgi:hypothetical protein
MNPCPQNMPVNLPHTYDDGSRFVPAYRPAHPDTHRPALRSPTFRVAMGGLGIGGCQKAEYTPTEELGRV